MSELLGFEDALAVFDEMHLVLADPGLLASAVGRPAATMFGEDAYPDLITEIAALLESVVRNHALVDGNKRAGWALARIDHGRHEASGQPDRRHRTAKTRGEVRPRTLESYESTIRLHVAPYLGTQRLDPAARTPRRARPAARAAGSATSVLRVLSRAARRTTRTRAQPASERQWCERIAYRYSRCVSNSIECEAVDTATLPSIISRADLTRLGLSAHQLYTMAKAGDLEQIAPGIYARPGDLDDTTATWAAIGLRKPSATICLLSALSLHDLTDQIPRETDIALPRGERTLSTKFAPIRWHSFNRATFDLGRTTHRLTDDGLTIGLYSPERTIIDAFRLRHEIGADIANDALKRWLRRRGNTPAELLELGRSFPKALPALRSTLEILL